MPDIDHLTEFEIAAFAEGRLDTAERRHVTAHLDECTRCRRELAEVLQLAETLPAEPTPLPARRPRRVSPWIAAGLAAGLVGILVYRGRPADPLVDTIRTPAAGTADAAPRIAAITPPEGGLVPATGARFLWAAAPAESYAFVLLEEDGTPKWSIETTDTSVTLPLETVLEPGRIYFWRVNALTDGISATTGATRIQVLR
jgi:hypothetical protein